MLSYVQKMDVISWLKNEIKIFTSNSMNGWMGFLGAKFSVEKGGQGAEKSKNMCTFRCTLNVKYMYGKLVSKIIHNFKMTYIDDSFSNRLAH